jgi:hypothetical protein
VDGRKIENDIRANRQKLYGDGIAHIPLNINCLPGPQTLLQEFRIRLIPRRLDINQRNFLCQIFAQQVLGKVCPNKACSAKDRHVAYSVHAPPILS